MTVATSLIPGLDEIVRSDDPKRRTEAARQISELFLQGVVVPRKRPRGRPRKNEVAA